MTSRDLHPVRLATRAFVGAVGRAREQNAPAIGGLRRAVVLQAIFRVLPRYVDRRRAERIDEAAVEFRIRDGRGRVDIWTLLLADGRARVHRGGAERPRTRLEFDTGDFLALATGHADAFALWSRNRIQIDGDLLFAAAVGNLFRVPRRRAPRATGAESHPRADGRT